MKRREFLASALAAGPAAVIAADDASGDPAGAPDRPNKAVRVTAGEDRFHERVKLFGSSPNDCKVSTSDTDGAMCVFESTVSQKGGPPTHVHDDQDEWFYIMEGEFEFQVGDDRFRLGTGDSVLAPRKIPHVWARVSDKPGRMMVLFQPAGKMEDFFRELGKLTAFPRSEDAQRIFMAHGMKIVGPPLPID